MWLVFKPSERLLLMYRKEEEAFQGKVPPFSPLFLKVEFLFLI